MTEQNSKRSKGAAMALEANAAFANTDGPSIDPGSSLIDLLTNLRHWCEESGVDFDVADTMSWQHFSAEQERPERTEPEHVLWVGCVDGRWGVWAGEPTQEGSTRLVSAATQPEAEKRRSEIEEILAR